MKTMSRLSAAERRQQNVGSRASAAARGHGRACRRCDNKLQQNLFQSVKMGHCLLIAVHNFCKIAIVKMLECIIDCMI